MDAVIISLLLTVGIQTVDNLNNKFDNSNNSQLIVESNTIPDYQYIKGEYVSSN